MKYLPSLLLTILCNTAINAYATTSEVTLSYSKFEDSERSNENKFKFKATGRAFSGNFYFDNLDEDGPLPEQGFLSKQNKLSVISYTIDPSSAGNDDFPLENINFNHFSYQHNLYEQFFIGAGYDDFLETKSITAGYYVTDTTSVSLHYTNGKAFFNNKLQSLGINVHSVLMIKNDSWIGLDATYTKVKLDRDNSQDENAGKLNISYYITPYISISGVYTNRYVVIDFPPQYAEKGESYGLTGTYYINEKFGYSIDWRSSKPKNDFGGQSKRKTVLITIAAHFRF